MDEEIKNYLELMHTANLRGFDQMNQRFDQMNGRVRKAENDVAVLKDRDDRAERAAQSAKRSSWISGLMAMANAVSTLLGALKP